MKAFILAAGHGTRLYPLTARIPKCLVPIRGIPILQIWLDLCQLHGIDEVTINTHAHAVAVREFVAQAPGSLKIRVFDEPALLGSAGTLSANVNWIADDPEFFVLYGDVLTNIDLTRMLRLHRALHQPATIAVHNVRNACECGIATVSESGVVTGFVEKPAHPRSNLAFSGVMICNPAVLSEIPPLVPADIGCHLLPRLIGRMAAYSVQEYLTDIGNLTAYDLAQRGWPGIASPTERTPLTDERMRQPASGGVRC
jgi:mannose-1-phosphate guanylyltransferase